MDNKLHDKFRICKTDTRKIVFVREMVPFLATGVYNSFTIWNFILSTRGTYVVKEVNDLVM